MYWTLANVWASTLTVGGFNNWRLPTTLQPDFSCSNQSGGNSSGIGCTGGEMGHLYNVKGIAATAPGLFSNVQANFYWSGTEFALIPSNAWVSSFYIGNGSHQGATSKGNPAYGWAVRSGDVSADAPVPEPSTMILLSTGLAGLIAWRQKRRHKPNTV